MAGFGQVQRTRFVDVTPGSKIRVSDYATPPAYEPFDAVVLDMQPEYGTNRIPMLLVKAEHATDPIPLMADGRTNVDVLVPSSVLVTDKRDPNARHMQAIPVEVYGIQFMSGVDSAAACITFAAGHAGLTYDRGSDGRTESLVLHSVNGDERCFPGDWVIEDVETGTITFESGASLESKYEDFEA